MALRIADWIYWLVYPALLATFIFLAIAGDGGCPNPPWQYLLILYFNLHYLEGVPEGRGDPVAASIVGAMECGLMLLAFAALFPGQFSAPRDLTDNLSLILAAIFLVPPLVRLVRERRTMAGPSARFHGLAAGLSLAAAIIVLLPAVGLIAEGVAWWLVALLLIFHAVVLTLCNELLPRRATWLQRPEHWPSGGGKPFSTLLNLAVILLVAALLWLVLLLLFIRAEERCGDPYRPNPPDPTPSAAVEPPPEQGMLGTIRFRTGRAELTEWSREMVSYQATRLAACTGYRVRLAGHADDQSSSAFNAELSRRRAEAVRSALVEEGLDYRFIAASGHGEGDPATADQGPSGRFDNRRVDIFYTCRRTGG